MVRSLVLMIMLVLGLHSGIVAASAHEEACMSRSSALRRQSVNHVHPAVFEKFAGANKNYVGHSNPGKAPNCCFNCSMAATVTEVCQNAVTARLLDVILPVFATNGEQIRPTGLRRPPKFGLLNT